MAELFAVPKPCAGGVSDGFVCPPPDEGFTSIVYRLHAFAGAGVTLLTVGVVDLVAVGLLLGCTHAAGRPERLRYLRKWAFGVGGVATVPFVGTVLMVGHRVLRELTRGEWELRLFNHYMVRNVVSSVLILLIGAIAAGSPAVMTALTSCRLRLATEGRDLDLRQLQKWAALGGAPVAAQFALATWVAASGNIGWAITHVLSSEVFEAHLPEAIVACFILLGLSAAAVAAIVLPVRAVTRSMHLRKPPVYELTVPPRFAGCVPNPQPQPAKA